MSDKTSKGLIFSGVAGSEATDSSGESLDVEGADITSMHDGTCMFNWEHVQPEDGKYAPGEEIVGKVIYAKKIFSLSDCENDDQRYYWKEVVKEHPYIYVVGRLFDAAGHKGAQALAAIMRDAVANGEDIVVGMSVEGSTLKRDKDNPNHLLATCVRKVALTVAPCNKTAKLRIMKDSEAPEGFKADHVEEDILAEVVKQLEERKTEDKLGKSSASLYRPFTVSDEKELVKKIAKSKLLLKLNKTLTAGGYDVAPSQLTGGSALMVEDRGRREAKKKKTLAVVKSYLKETEGTQNFNKETMRKLLKMSLPDASDEYIDHFTDIAEDYTIKLRKSESLIKTNPKSLANAERLSEAFHRAFQKRYGSDLTPDCQHASTVVGAALEKLGHKVKIVGGVALGADAGQYDEPDTHYWLDVDGSHFDPKAHITKIPYTQYSSEWEWSPDEAIQNSVEDATEDEIAELTPSTKKTLKKNENPVDEHLSIILDPHEATRQGLINSVERDNIFATVYEPWERAVQNWLPANERLKNGKVQRSVAGIAALALTKQDLMPILDGSMDPFKEGQTANKLLTTLESLVARHRDDGKSVANTLASISTEAPQVLELVGYGDLAPQSNFTSKVLESFPKHFHGREKQAALPAFWLQWLSNKEVEHWPFWDSVKNELIRAGIEPHPIHDQQVSSNVRAGGRYVDPWPRHPNYENHPMWLRGAVALARLKQKWGVIPATLAYYSHILPHIENAESPMHPVRNGHPAYELAKAHSLLITLRKAVDDAVSDHEKEALSNVLHVYRYRHHNGKISRHLIGRLLTLGNHLKIVDDHHGELAEKLKEGQMHDGHLESLAQLSNSPHHEVETLYNIYSGNRPDLWHPSYGGTKPQEKPIHKWVYQREGIEPAEVEIRGDLSFVNGEEVPLHRVAAMLESAKQGQATIDYHTSLRKNDNPFGSPHEALAHLDQLVRSGAVDPRAVEALRSHIFTDPMTDGKLGNKYAHDDWKARNPNHGGVVVMADANNFKMVNDMYGHEAGDKAINHMGHAVRAALDEAHPEAKGWRLGGDEMAFHFPDSDSAHRFLRSAQTHLDKIQPVEGKHKLSVSFGLGTNHEEADKALYEAKKQKYNPEDMIGTDSRKWQSKYEPHNTPHFAHSLLPGAAGPVPLQPQNTIKPPKPLVELPTTNPTPEAPATPEAPKV